MPTVSDFTALLSNTSWAWPATTAAPAVVTYSFLEQGDLPNVAASPESYYEAEHAYSYSSAQRAGIRLALAEFSEYSGLVFLEAETGGTMSFFGVSGSTVAGFALYPGAGLRRSIVVIEQSIFTDFSPGTSGFSTLLHEIGHAVGLKHPNEGEIVLDPANLGQTVMGGWEAGASPPAVLPPLDLDAIHHLYGLPGGLDNVVYSFDEAESLLSLVGSDAGDILVGTHLSSRIDGGGGADRIYVAGGSREITAGTGDDLIHMADGEGSVDGGIGDDTFALYGTFGSGGGTIHGRDGHDVLDASGAVRLTFDDAIGKYLGIEAVIGSGNDDFFRISSALNVYGGAGDDQFLVGGADRVMIEGGAGSDILGIDLPPGSDEGIRGNLAAGTVSGGGVDVVFSGIEGFSGTDLDDVMIGDEQANQFVVQGSNDKVEAGAGDDVVVVGGFFEAAEADGGPGFDIIDLSDSFTFPGVRNKLSLLDNTVLIGEDASFDPVITHTGFEGLLGTGGEDDLVGDAGDNLLRGGGGFDTLWGGEGDDVLDGGANPEGASGQGDVMLGGEGDDTYHVDSGLDLVDEGGYFPGYGFGGFDTIISTTDFYWDIASVGERLVVSEDAVDAGGDGVTIVGSVFDNELIGHSGTDVMFGRGGSDTYRAGDGVDFMSLSTLGLTDENAYAGVNGSNTVVVAPRASGPFSYDIVFEFESGKDRLDVSAYAEINGFETGADVLARGVNVDFDGDGSVDGPNDSSYFILGDGLDYLYMVGTTLSEISADDFIV